MSSNAASPYNIAGKGVQGGAPADLNLIRFNLANNQWEFVLGAGGEANTGANVGVGTGLVFRNKVGVVLNFKSLLQGTNMTVTNNADDITIATLAEINLAANVGAGTGLIFRDKTGVTLNLKSLIAGAGITINNNADDIEIISTGGGGVSEVEFLQGKDAAGDMIHVTGKKSGTGVAWSIVPPVATTTVIYQVGASMASGGANSLIEAQLRINAVVIETYEFTSTSSPPAGPVANWLTKGKQLIGDGAKAIDMNVLTSSGTGLLFSGIEAYDL